MLKGDPLVSIRCLVYNHEPYLRQCLDGFVMQKTTFPFEAIVHDDASTDGSAAIIREYAEKYPDIIKPIYETENQFSKPGDRINHIMRAAVHPNAKYVAMCEGDDYWTDPHKLQLQVDFLESHPDYYMTCHAYLFYYEDTKAFEPHPFLDEMPLESFNGREYCTPSIDEYFNPIWFTQATTLVRRNQPYATDETLDQYPLVVDHIECYYMLKAGKCALFKDVMGVYRKHSSGLFSGHDLLKWAEIELRNKLVLYQLEKDHRVLRSIDQHFVDTFIPYLSQKNFSKARQVLSEYVKVVPIKNSINSLKRIIMMGVRSVGRPSAGTNDIR